MCSERTKLMNRDNPYETSSHDANRRKPKVNKITAHHKLPDGEKELLVLVGGGGDRTLMFCMP